MPWTEASDTDARCGDPPGRVADEEFLARLIHEKNPVPGRPLFRQSEVTPPTDAPLEDDCRLPKGSHGFSLTRPRDHAEARLFQMAEALAALKPGRKSMGYRLGSAARARGVRLRDRPEEQVVFVYDDPSQEDAAHVVLRVKETLTKGECSYVRDRLETVFAEHRPPPEALVA